MKFLMWLLIGYCVYLLFFKDKLAKKAAEPETESGEETFRDPVCGVYVSADDAVVGRIEGERVHFCSMACLEKFRDSLENKAKAP